MLSEDIIALYTEVGRRMAKHAANISAANRSSSAFQAVRTKWGAIGDQGSKGRIPGAPSVKSPGVQGVQAPHAERAPNLAFPAVPKPPSRVS